VQLVVGEESYRNARCRLRPGAHGFLAGMKGWDGKTEDILVPQMHSGLICGLPRNIRQECSKLLLNCPVSFGAEIARPELLIAN